MACACIVNLCKGVGIAIVFVAALLGYQLLLHVIASLCFSIWTDSILAPMSHYVIVLFSVPLIALVWIIRHVKGIYF